MSRDNYLFHTYNVFYTPFDNVIKKSAINLIKTSDLQCNTDELPQYGVAVQSKKTQELEGYIGAHGKYGDVAHIDILVVGSGTRDKGLGTCLINEMCNLLIELNYTSFTAEVEADNSSAISLYLKLGAELKMSFGLNMSLETVANNSNKLMNYHNKTS